jgi:hypothetical protein
MSLLLAYDIKGNGSVYRVKEDGYSHRNKLTKVSSGVVVVTSDINARRSGLLRNFGERRCFSRSLGSDYC